MVEWLREIIPDAKSFEIVANVVLAAVALILGAVTAKRVKQKQDTAGDAVEVAGAIVDSTMARALVAAIEANTRALDDRMIALNGLANHLKAVKDEIAESNQRLEHIKDELIRHSR